MQAQLGTLIDCFSIKTPITDIIKLARVVGCCNLVWRRIGPQAQCQHLRKLAAWKNRLQLAKQTQLEQLLFN